MCFINLSNEIIEEQLNDALIKKNIMHGIILV